MKNLFYFFAFYLISVVGVFTYHYVLAGYYNASYPFISPFFLIEDQPKPIIPPVFGKHTFDDYYVTYYNTQLDNPYLKGTPFRSNYLPLTHLVLKPFTWVSYKFSYLLFVAFCVSVIFSLVFLLLQDLPFFARVICASFISFLNYPILYTLDRGNIEILCFVFVLFWFYFCRRKNPILAGICLGIAAGTKIFPGIFALYHFRKKERITLLAFVVTVIAGSLLAMLFLSGNLFLNFKNVLESFVEFRSLLLVGTGASNYSSSLYSMLKAFYYFFREGHAGSFFYYLSYPFKWMASTYFIFGLYLFYRVVRYIWQERPPLWLELYLWAVSIILLPKTSYDYRLLYLWVPLLLLFLRKDEDRSSEFKGYEYEFTIVFFSLCIVLIPKPFIRIHHTIGISVVINALTMLFSLKCILNPKPDSSFYQKVRGALYGPKEAC